MKKIIILNLLFITLFVSLLSSCIEKKFNIGIIIYDRNDTFMGEYANNIKNNLILSLGNKVEYQILYSQNSQSTQNIQILQLIDDKIDLLIINPVDRLATSTISEMCNRNKIPIIFINREPLLADIINYENIFYVGAAPENQGKLQADMISNLFGDPNKLSEIYDKNHDNKIQLIVLKGEQGHQDAEIRTASVIDRLNNLGYHLDVLSIMNCNWKTGEAYDSIKKYFTLIDPEINVEAIISNNDDMAIGAINYFEEIELFKKVSTYYQEVVIVGVDGTVVGKKAVNDGLLYGTIENDSLTQSLAVVKLVSCFVNKTNVSDINLTFTNDRYIYVDGNQIIKE